jgi:uncharacterized protein YndB with AHSA1/START domain
MRWAVIVLAVALALLVVVFAIGMTRPKGHVARTQAKYTGPPEAVWATLADFERWSEWNPEVKSVERLPDRNGHQWLNVVGTWGDAPTEITVWEPPTRLHTSMDAGSFRGGWSYDLSQTADGGTLLTVTEEGEVQNPIFRAFMLFHDNYATMTSFHRALATRLGEAVTPVKVPTPN